MTRDELRVRIWERFCIVLPEVTDPIGEIDAIMDLVDIYSVGIVQEVWRAYVQAAQAVTEQIEKELMERRK